MADRIALAIEPDTDTANQIRRLLEPKGFKVESISNGDDAMEWGRTNKPSVIILSVEPRKVGYAISNKLRRSPSLREVPLVMISSEETLATFEQHKKLKSRADEYLLKPLEESVFVTKVAGLVGIEAGDDDVHELDADSDIVLAEDDEDVIVDGDSDDEERTQLMGDGVVRSDTSEQAVQDTGQTPFEGEKFDPETQAAFAALEAGGGEGSLKSDDMVDLRNLWSDDDLPPNLGWEQDAGARPRPRQGSRRPVPGRSRQLPDGRDAGPRGDRFACVSGAGARSGRPGGRGSARAGRVRVRRRRHRRGGRDGAAGRPRGRAACQGGRGAQLGARGAHPLAGERAPDVAQGDRGGARAVHAVGDVLEGA